MFYQSSLGGGAKFSTALRASWGNILIPIKWMSSALHGKVPPVLIPKHNFSIKTKQTCIIKWYQIYSHLKSSDLNGHYYTVLTTISIDMQGTKIKQNPCIQHLYSVYFCVSVERAYPFKWKMEATDVYLKLVSLCLFKPKQNNWGPK